MQGPPALLEPAALPAAGLAPTSPLPSRHTAPPLGTHKHCDAAAQVFGFLSIQLAVTVGFAAVCMYVTPIKAGGSGGDSPQGCGAGRRLRGVGSGAGPILLLCVGACRLGWGWEGGGRSGVVVVVEGWCGCAFAAGVARGCESSMASSVPQPGSRASPALRFSRTHVPLHRRSTHLATWRPLATTATTTTTTRAPPPTSYEQSYVRSTPWPFYLAWALALALVIVLSCSPQLRRK